VIEIQDLKTKIQQILLDHSTLFSTSNKNPFEDLDQIISLIKSLQNEIKELQRYERLQRTKKKERYEYIIVHKKNDKITKNF